MSKKEDLNKAKDLKNEPIAKPGISIKPKVGATPKPGISIKPK